MEKRIIGVTEKVTIKSASSEEIITARIDTGAENSSIDTILAAKLNLGPVVKTRIVKNVHGTARRSVIEVSIVLSGVEIKTHMTIADRANMTYPALIGQSTLRGMGFLVDPDKKAK
ncbi:MAG: hypothetical protein GY861_10760 [bacterium]|nr:hypothetical protein [bacterium]